MIGSLVFLFHVSYVDVVLFFFSTSESVSNVHIYIEDDKLEKKKKKKLDLYPAFCSYRCLARIATFTFLWEEVFFFHLF